MRFIVKKQPEYFQKNLSLMFFIKLIKSNYYLFKEKTKFSMKSNFSSFFHDIFTINKNSFK